MHLCLHVGNKQNKQKSHTSPFLKEQLDIGNVWCDHCRIASVLYLPQIVWSESSLTSSFPSSRFFLPTPAPDPSTLTQGHIIILFLSTISSIQTLFHPIPSLFLSLWCSSTSHHFSASCSTSHLEHCNRLQADLPTFRVSYITIHHAQSKQHHNLKNRVSSTPATLKIFMVPCFLQDKIQTVIKWRFLKFG